MLSLLQASTVQCRPKVKHAVAEQSHCSKTNKS